MKLTLRQQITQFQCVLQNELFPVLEEAVGELDQVAKRLVATLEMIPLARFIPVSRGWMGRPSKDRYALACAFVAKAVYGFSLTRQVIERLHQDEQLRQICGWKTVRHLPHESTFSRAFAEFAEMELPQFVHEALIVSTQKERLIGHIARDSTTIEVRERFPEPMTKRQRQRLKAQARREPKRGPRGPHKRYKGGKPVRQPKDNTRIHRQRSMSLAEMLAELPRQCSLGVKTSRGGNQQYTRGYKLHIDVADGQIPISCILTAASLHDSQAAIPLATMSALRVTNLYDVADSAYGAIELVDHSRSLGHVPIFAAPKRWGKTIRQFSWAEEDRYRERTMVERVFARLKDEYGGRHVRVRGYRKVMAHLMFGMLVLTVDQILRLAG